VNHNTTTQPPTALTLAAPRHSSHDLRKIYASMLIENGESIVKVSRRLGHKKISTTFDHYAKLIESQK